MRDSKVRAGELNPLFTLNNRLFLLTYILPFGGANHSVDPREQRSAPYAFCSARLGLWGSWSF